MPKSYDGTEFAKALAAGGFKAPIVLTGVAKQAENDPEAIMFAEGTLCQSWVKIPWRHTVRQDSYNKNEAPTDGTRGVSC